jgi:subtilase family serine protease
MTREFFPTWFGKRTAASVTARKRHRRFLSLESLDERVLLSSSPVQSFTVPLVPAQTASAGVAMVNGPASSPVERAIQGSTITAAEGTLPANSGYTPQQISNAYGFNQVLPLTGAGMTIAILDPGHDPTIASDLQQFDRQFGMANPPSFSQVNESGQSSNYPTLQSAGMSEETSLDVEWAHAMAPAANILLVEYNATPTGTAPNGNSRFSASLGDILQAINTARSSPGVVAVSMSFDDPDGTAADDPYFTTPSGHTGVTFVAASGDSGGPSQWPATSPNVLSVGGTDLPLVVCHS